MSVSKTKCMKKQQTTKARPLCGVFFLLFSIPFKSAEGWVAAWLVESPLSMISLLLSTNEAPALGGEGLVGPPEEGGRSGH